MRRSFRSSETRPRCVGRGLRHESPRSMPETCDPVTVKHRIGTHERNGLNQTLSHKEPVKRIPVVERQSHLLFGELEREGDTAMPRSANARSTHWRYGSDRDSFRSPVLMESSQIVPTLTVSSLAGFSKTALALVPSRLGSSNAQIKVWASKRCLTP